MVLKGNPVSGGVAVGKLYVYEPFEVNVAETLIEKEQIKAELEKYEEAKRNAQAELQAICEKLEKDDPEKAKIFIAHQDILFDEAMHEEIVCGVEEELWAPDWAIQKVYGKFSRMLKNVPDPLIQERAADIEDVQKRLLRIWYGVPESNLANLDEPIIVVARDLLPSDTATLDRSKVLAILTEIGGSTSHSAIIARSYEIPAILGIDGLLGKVQAGQMAAIDAITGEVITDPSDEETKDFEKRRADFQKHAAETKKYLDKEPLSSDGVRIDIGLNIGSANPQEMEGAKYTDLVGLFRTEFLYMGHDALPTEDEQYEIYKEVLEAYGERPVTLRTLDIGGDKTLDCMCLPKEDNPFLGNRALRLCFSQPEIFKTQLRAALRASVHGNLWSMFPMVGSMDDIRRAKDCVAEAKAELDKEGIAYSDKLKIGIMIEIPAIAMIADIAAAEVDFASIGTNDLCQYLMAVDRLNPEVSCYYQSYHPAMFRMIGQVVKAFNNAGKPICVCGEMGGDTLAAPVLVGLGMRKLSMGLASVAAVKRVLSSLSIAKMEEMAQAVLKMKSADEIENYLKENIDY